MSFDLWLHRAHVTNDPVGDFVADTRRGAGVAPWPAFERVTSLKMLRRIMRPHACDACMDCLPDVWKRYRRWERSYYGTR